jgi:hypothetical protein
VGDSYVRSRGGEVSAIEDILATRKFYEYTANVGRAHAAIALAKTYDPAFLTQFGADGVRPKPAEPEPISLM